MRKGEREPGRQLTMLSGDSVEAALAEAAIAPPASLGSLRCARTGGACFLHQNCVPCVYTEKKNGRPGLMQCLWDCAGVSCEVLRGDTLRTGDPVIIFRRVKLHLGTSMLNLPAHASIFSLAPRAVDKKK